MPLPVINVMTFRNRLAILAFTLVCSLSALADESTGDGFVDLLGGGNLDRFRGYQKEEVPEGWQLADGTVTLVEPGAGDLITREQYADFDFRFEWKISEGGNSGVVYRANEKGDQPYSTGVEYQVLDNAGFGAEPRHAAGALYAMYPSPLDATKPVGEWNTGRIVVNNSLVEHWLNGKKIVSAFWDSADWNEKLNASKFKTWPGFAENKTGHITFQDHGGVVSYRNLKIKRLNEGNAADGTPRRLLFVTQSGGFKHSAVTRKATDLSHCERIMQKLGIESGAFRVDCTQDVEEEFTPELLANYDVVAFYTTGRMYGEKRLPIPQETLDWFLNTWLAEEGHGFLGVHAGADTFEDYEPYWDMLGGSFNGHPWTANTDVVLKVHSGDHPATKPWGEAGASIALKDEIYQFKNWQPEKVRVLMSLDMEKTDLKKPYHVPVLWVKPYGAGRVMHMSLGHREDVWEKPAYQESLIGGIKWLLGQEAGDATPNPELSAEQEEIAEQAAKAPAPAAG